jgi:DNA-binding MarR family transcriptional regulator
MAELLDIYLAFANWRFQTQRATKIRRSIFFFRSSFDHTLIWTLVMRGYYRKALPSVRDCQNAASCSRLTTRKLLADAEALGFLVIRPAPNDSRKRLVHPTPRAVAEYEAMVKRYLGLWDTLLRAEPTLRARVRRGSRKTAAKVPSGAPVKPAEIRQK